MSDVSDAINRIEATAERLGLAELSRQSGIPYTTLTDMRGKGWRPKSVRIFERLIEVANLPPTAQGEAAA